MRSKDSRGGRGAPPSRSGFGPRPTRGSGKPEHHKSGAVGPSQRQLRAGELVRHALAEIMLEANVADPALSGVSVTISEVRMSPDLRHATCFVNPLGGVKADEVVAGLNRATRFFRGRLGPHVDLRFTPDLVFRHDESFETAAKMDALFDRLNVQRDTGVATPIDADPDEPKDDDA